MTKQQIKLAYRQMTPAQFLLIARLACEHIAQQDAQQGETKHAAELLATAEFLRTLQSQQRPQLTSDNQVMNV